MQLQVETTIYKDGAIGGDIANAKALTQAKYAISDTSSLTGAKIATLNPPFSNWQLFNGAEIFVKFDNQAYITDQTTTLTLALKSSSTDTTAIAYPIKDSDGEILPLRFYWKPNSTVHFMFDGVNWRVLDVVSASKYNSLITEVDNFNSTIGEHAEAIDSLGETVEDHSTMIDQTADSITSLAQGNTTYFDPITGESTSSSIGTMVQQTANNVLIKASQNNATEAEKAAGGASVIQSLINVAPEGVQISADKVNIQGAAIFESIPTKDEVVNDIIIEYGVGSSSSSHTDIDAKEEGTPGAWSPLTPTWTDGSYVWQRTTKTGYRYDDIHDTWVSEPIVTYACIQGAAGEGGTSYYTYIMYSANSDGSDMTSEPTADTIYIGLYTGEASVVPPYNDSGWTWSKYVGDPGGQGDQGYSVSEVKILYYLKSGTTAPSKPNSTDYPNGVISASTGVDIWTTAVPIYVTDYNYFVCAQTKLSNNSYIWSDPTINNGLTTSNQRAAEAMAKANSASYKEQRIYYRTSTVKTFVEADYPITWVNSDESSANVYNQWTTKIPPLSTDKTDPNANKYLYLYTCIQRQNVANELSHTKALLDESTTVIDGGNIVTGSIAANKISVGELSAINANMGQITAGSISKGNNFIDFDTGTLEFKDNNDWIYADQGIQWTGSELNIRGHINATSLTIGNGSSSYNGAAAINISGYTIEIVENSTGASEGSTYLYPHLYHNGDEVLYLLSTDTAVDNSKIYYTRTGTAGNYTYTIVSNPSATVNPSEEQYYELIDYSHFIWYREGDTTGIGTPGDVNNQGRYLATYGDSYRVIYEFDDGEVEGASAIQTRTVDPQKYITKINDYGITIHPEKWTNNQSSSIQLDGTGMELFNSSGDSIAKYGSTAKIGFDNSSRFLMNSNSLQAFDSNNNEYFHVDSNGLRWGSNIAATTEEVNIAAQTADNYITYMNSTDGIRIYDGLSTNRNVNFAQINSYGMQIYKGGDAATNKVAEFGETVVVGNQNKSHIMFDFHSMQLKDKEGNTYFHVSDLRDNTGTTTIQEKFIGDGRTSTYSLTLVAIDVSSIEVKLDGTITQNYTATTNSITFDSRPSNGQEILVEYITASTEAKAFTFGSRGNSENNAIGALSYAEGQSVEASGLVSHAEGYITHAIGKYSHAEGASTQATSWASHSEGYNTSATGRYGHAEGRDTIASGTGSHAEGITMAIEVPDNTGNIPSTASGMASHAEGGGCIASGQCSHAEGVITSAHGTGAHAQNYRTTAYSYFQTAMGRYNKEDRTGTYAVIVGNGSQDDMRSDAFTIDWDGNIQYAGSASQMSDRRLKEHISYLSTDAIDFIQNLKPVYFKKDKKSHLGFYAQDVEEIDKWNCMTGEMNGFKTLGYTEIIAPLVAYCQHLEERIKQLEEK